MGRSHVEVSGTGSASAAPDVVRVMAGVRCDGDTVAAALADAGGRAAALTQTGRDRGVPDGGMDTTPTGVHPRHDRDGARVVGYTAYQSLVVTTGDVVGVGSLVEAFAGAAGDALTIDHVGFEVGDPGPVLARAREAAFADARSKAQQYAALAGRRLGAVTVLADVAGGGAQPRYELMAASRSAAQVEPGETTVTATVVVRWDWE